ncbi:MAG TPA: DUF5683 domain-containing protein [Leptospiraceae bacterium]|nr:DUF5683 domain-containing protein [Leptospiraceae bacterium]HMY68796.1 DUF5683 domain-containing protein [Leptospiraceae bacterium]HNF14408.1 DUF5683 domain-containing protein [Leptospiraceae bacterium]HNF25011.1 DUF5683 domain-containing protein [Leptospiraceae bacterium]HNM05978.1 DUF5683 domain-containing protein [Leptospiraceae bacterium]
MKLLSAILVTLLLSAGDRLYADTVTRKSGAVLSNVKAFIKKGFIQVEFEDLSKTDFSKKDIKSVKFSPVVWKPKIPAKDEKTSAPVPAELETSEQERIREATVNGDEWQERPESEQISPFKNALLGLIPGYSGLYRTDNKLGGAVFTFLEITALLNYANIAGAKRQDIRYTQFLQDRQFGIFNLGLYNDNAGRGGTADTLINSFNSYYIQGFLLLKYRSNYIGAVDGKEILSAATGAELKNQRTTAAVILGAVLAADAVASYLAASSWNEGIFQGAKTARPTTRLSRFIRSALFPGWGQMYGGNDLKGLGYFAMGGMLLANVIQKEVAAVQAMNDFNSYNFLNRSINFLAVNQISRDSITSLFAADYLSGNTYQAAENAVRERNKAWTYYGAFWAWNLIDAVFLSGVNKTSTDLKVTPNVTYRNGFNSSGRYSLETYVTLAVTKEIL